MIFWSINYKIYHTLMFKFTYYKLINWIDSILSSINSNKSLNEDSSFDKTHWNYEKRLGVWFLQNIFLGKDDKL